MYMLILESLVTGIIWEREGQKAALFWLLMAMLKVSVCFELTLSTRTLQLALVLSQW